MLSKKFLLVTTVGLVALSPLAALGDGLITAQITAQDFNPGGKIYHSTNADDQSGLGRFLTSNSCLFKFDQQVTTAIENIQTEPNYATTVKQYCSACDPGNADCGTGKSPKDPSFVLSEVLGGGSTLHNSKGYPVVRAILSMNENIPGQKALVLPIVMKNLPNAPSIKFQDAPSCTGLQKQIDPRTHQAVDFFSQLDVTQTSNHVIAALVNRTSSCQKSNGGGVAPGVSDFLKKLAPPKTAANTPATDSIGGVSDQTQVAGDDDGEIKNSCLGAFCSHAGGLQ